MASYRPGASRPVAVKLLHAQFGHDSGALDRFRASARCAASLVHQGIVRVFDYGESDSDDGAGRPFLVMEFVDGPPLADLLASGPVAAAQAMDVIAQTAVALDAAHRAGCLNGDLGPQNILLRQDGAVKLIGFGAAHGSGGNPGSAAGDLHALGVLAYLCLTGGKAPADAAGPAGPRQIPEPVAAFVSQLTAREPATRPATAAEVGRRAARLRDRLGRAGQPAPPAAADTPLTTTMPDLPAWRSQPTDTGPRGRLAVRAFAVVALMLAAVVLLGLLKPGSTTSQADGTTKVTTVRVHAAGLIGRPVNVVRRHPERLGLVVRVRWQPSDRVSPGKVLSVRPSGPVSAHSRIMLIGSIRPPGYAGVAPAAAQTGNPARHRRSHVLHRAARQRTRRSQHLARHRPAARLRRPAHPHPATLPLPAPRRTQARHHPVVRHHPVRHQLADQAARTCWAPRQSLESQVRKPITMGGSCMNCLASRPPPTTTTTEARVNVETSRIGSQKHEGPGQGTPVVNG